MVFEHGSHLLFKAIRKFLAMIVIFIDWVTKPKPIQRIETDQIQAQEKVKGLALYQLHACPFCVKVRRAIHRLNVDIEIRDVNKLNYRTELETQGGRVMTPCLRIERDSKVEWLYESGEIIGYLDALVGVSTESKLTA